MIQEAGQARPKQVSLVGFDYVGDHFTCLGCWFIRIPIGIGLDLPLSEIWRRAFMRASTGHGWGRMGAVQARLYNRLPLKIPIIGPIAGVVVDILVDYIKSIRPENPPATG